MYGHSTIKMVRRVTFAGILVNVAIAAAKAVAGVIEFEPKELYKWPADFPPV